MSAPAVSVLMTAFNRERYVAEAIESVLGQTFEDFELVVVDDASHDRTVDIARKYEADPRVRVVVNERNLGDYPNRNRAAALARGEFIKFHDSDDVMYPHCLAAMVEPLRAEPGAALALSSGWHWPGGPCPMLLTPRLAYQREFLGQGLFMCGPAGALIRTDVFRSLGGFPERGAASDYVFWLKACASVGVLLVPPISSGTASTPARRSRTPWPRASTRWCRARRGGPWARRAVRSAPPSASRPGRTSPTPWPSRRSTMSGRAAGPSPAVASATRGSRHGTGCGTRAPRDGARPRERRSTATANT